MSSFRFRPATLDDARISADIVTAYHPDEPCDPSIERYVWANPNPEDFVERFVAETSESKPVAVASWYHADWSKLPRRFAALRVNVVPELASGSALGELFAFVEDRAVAGGSEVLIARAREDDQTRQTFLRDNGYRQERLGKNWELDLVSHRQPLLEMADRARERMAAENVRLLTLDRDGDADRFTKLHELSNAGESDVPTTVPAVPPPFDTFMKWFQEPGLRQDRFWIAREGERIVGLSVLSYPPERGNVWTEGTTVARSARGRGIARALKLETVAQAIELGVLRVRTQNDGENAPILHLNDQLGYRRIPGALEFHRPLS